MQHLVERLKQENERAARLQEYMNELVDNKDGYRTISSSRRKRNRVKKKSVVDCVFFLFC